MIRFTQAGCANTTPSMTTLAATAKELRKCLAIMNMTKIAVIFPQQQEHLALMYVKFATRRQWKNQSVSVKQNAQRKKSMQIALYAAVKTAIFPAVWVRQ